jgi:Polyketide cyclase / dehydrase and lipid transport
VALLSHAETPLDVGRSAADTYAYLADFARHAEWAHTYLSVELQAGAPARVGTKLVVHEKQDLRWDKRPQTTIADRAGANYATELEITALDLPRQIGWQTRYAGGPFDGVRGEWEFVLEPVLDTITIVRFRAALLEPREKLIAYGEALLRQGHPIDVLARQVDRAMHNIRTILEGRA